jgi:hypothetical protein
LRIRLWRSRANLRRELMYIYWYIIQTHTRRFRIKHDWKRFIIIYHKCISI